MSENDHPSDLVGAYVLDALDSTDREMFESHLVSCASCRQEVSELQQVVDVLPLACDLAEPSGALRQRILTAVEEDTQGDTSRPILTPMSGGRPKRSVTRLPRWTGAMVVAVAAAAAIVLAVWNVQLQQSISSQKAALEFQQKVTAALVQGASVSPVRGTSFAPGAAGAMVQPSHSRTAYLIVKGLPATPARKVYQLWLIRNNQPRSAQLFQYSGSAPEVVRLPMPVSGFTVAAVTVEPGPVGSAGPTGPQVLVGPLRA